MYYIIAKTRWNKEVLEVAETKGEARDLVREYRRSFENDTKIIIVYKGSK